MLTHPRESPSHASSSYTVADDSLLLSLTVAGAAPELPMPWGLWLTGFPFHPEYGEVFRAPDANSDAAGL